MFKTLKMLHIVLRDFIELIKYNSYKKKLSNYKEHVNVTSLIHITLIIGSNKGYYRHQL